MCFNGILLIIFIREAYTLVKREDRMKTIRIVMTGLFIAALAGFAGAQTRNTIVTGTVVDSATGLPVPGALVLFYDSDSIPADIPAFMNNFISHPENFQFDTTITGADGRFSDTIAISTKTVVLVCGVIKPGYMLKYDFRLMLLPVAAVNFGTLRISKPAAADKDTIMVTGKVVDSLTGAPLANTLVVMSGLGGLDTAGNLVLTGADGTFSKQVIIARFNNMSVVGYVANRTGYVPKVGSSTATSKQLDLGTIALVPSNHVIFYSAGGSFAGNRPDAMTVYSLSGKLLYNGPSSVSIEKAAGTSTGTMLVVFKRNNKIVNCRQVVLAR